VSRDRRVLRVHDPAEQWERFGRVDPYYGVLAGDEFRRENLDGQALDRFFATGEEHVESVLESARRVAGSGFAPATVLDHGCGVGRLLVAFARHAERTVGVDVSPSMLAEARRNCDARGVENVELLPADRLATLAPDFDLVHSYIVLQHIPPRAGLPIVDRLASLVRPSGVGMLHVPVSAPNLVARLHTWTTRTVPYAYNVANLVRGRPWSYPHMQMNVYPLDALVLLLRRRGFYDVHLKFDHGGTGADYVSCAVVFTRR
jgi:2-polyprenyl-3-methyl-5-hydroxy-6-metoxy-1,4-benzoquinol methylase